jgi:uncharacterized membrane protein
MRKLWLGWLMIAASAVFSAVMFSRLPERVVSHWGANGESNGWTSRIAFVVGIHAVAVFVGIAVVVAPKIDPRRYNFPANQRSYWLVTNAILVLLALVTALAIGINAGWNLRIEWTGYGLGAFFVVMGNVLTRVRPNWIFGVRTSWTLSSDRSWRATHRIAGYGFVLLGLAVLVTAATSAASMIVVLLPGVAIVVLASVARSYFVWKNDSTVLHPK